MKITRHVNRDAGDGFNFRVKKRYTGLNNPVTTAARINTDINGQKRRTSNMHEMINRAKKNHKIILDGCWSSILSTALLNRFYENKSGCLIAILGVWIWMVRCNINQMSNVSIKQAYRF